MKLAGSIRRRYPGYDITWTCVSVCNSVFFLTEHYINQHEYRPFLTMVSVAVNNTNSHLSRLFRLWMALKNLTCGKAPAMVTLHRHMNQGSVQMFNDAVQHCTELHFSSDNLRAGFSSVPPWIQRKWGRGRTVWLNPSALHTSASTELGSLMSFPLRTR